MTTYTPSMQNNWLEPHTHPLIVGHRGASAHAPENTLAAFRLACEQGADGIELDVKLCASGEVVVMHDPTIDRTTSGSGKVHECAFSLLQSVDAGRGEPVPSLDQVFEEVGRDLLINVEVTNYTTQNDGLEAAVAAVVQRHGIAARILFSSFSPFSLRRLSMLAPHVPRAILYSPDLPLPLRRVWAAPLIRHEFRHPEYTMVTHECVQSLARRGVRVNTWTVDDPAEMRRVADCGVAGIIGDSPQTMRQVLGMQV
jgi:glycerophosphoryl diester phosphodiesterase